MKGIKRIVSTDFWRDEKVLNDFSPEDKLFMLFLLTNPGTSQLGIYHLPIKEAALWLGYSVEAVIVLLDRFESKYKMIRYNKETSEVAIKNFLMHSIIKGGQPVLDCLMADVKNIKEKALVDWIVESLEGKEVNSTVKRFVGIYKHINDNDNENDNDNDNDNERYVNVSYDAQKKQKKMYKSNKYDKNKFNRFEQRNTDYNALEKALLEE